MEEKTKLSELIIRSRAHDDEAFSELVSLYTPLMNKEVGEFSSSAIGYDELFSEACIALHAAVLKYDLSQNKVTFGLFAKICIHHKLIDLVSALPTIGSSEIDVERISVTAALDSRLADRERFENLMRSASEILSDYEYRVLLLHVQGYKTSEIAELLSRESKSVDNAKNRIFKRLRDFSSESAIKSVIMPE